jgi:hypothetical protein
MVEASGDAEGRLAAIREHCDQGLRYYAWAVKRMPSIPEQAEYVPQVENDMYALALVLAYVEGASTEREALLAARGITARYIEAVEAEGWEPSFGTRHKPTDGS